MKRFFAFGCSYTSYSWPTWADFISQSSLFDEAYNFGVIGAGNQLILTRLVNAHRVFKFTADDTVIVCWSTVNREDRIKNRAWVAGGNVFNHFYYDESFLDKYWDFNDALVKTTTSIFTGHELLSKLGTKFHFTSMLGTTMMFDEYKNNELTNYDPEVLEYTQGIVDDAGFLEGIDERFVNGTSVFKMTRSLVKLPSIGKQKYDHHPSPYNHLEWVHRNFPEHFTDSAIRLRNQYQRLTDSVIDTEIIREEWHTDKRNPKNNYPNDPFDMLL